MGLKHLRREWNARNSILVILGAVLSLVAMWTTADGQTSVPFDFTTPGVEFGMRVDCITAGDCTKLEWERQESGGAWLPFADSDSPTGIHEVRDTLANRNAARYRAKAYSVGWTCDANGCQELGDRVYGPLGEPSNWIIGFTPPGPPGGCGKPAKQ